MRELIAHTEPLQRILVGDVREGLRSLPDGSVQTTVTSPPYWNLRDYGVDGQLGSEHTPDEFIANMVEVFRDVRRVLRDDGTLWLNIGDSYANDAKWGSPCIPLACLPPVVPPIGRRRVFSGAKPKELCGIPWRLALALSADGWYLRQDIIWHKPAPMPESVTDRCTKSHEYLFLLAKSERYYFDAEAIRERSIKGAAGSRFDAGKTAEHQLMRASNGDRQESEFRNRRSVWTISTQPYPGSHFATYPPRLVLPCIQAGTSEHGCCAKCGAPYKRITNRRRITRERPNDLTKRTGDEGTGNYCPNSVAGVAIETVGWEPVCKCGAGIMPCTVLDPFLGSGTTLAVARHLGRRGIGCELNEDYAVNHALVRIAEPLRLPKEKKPKRRKKVPHQRELTFGD